MMPTSLVTQLTCLACGGKHFVTIVELKRTSKLGMITSPAGYACVACHTQVNVQQMIERDEVDRMEKDLQERQATLAARQTAAVPKERA